VSESSRERAITHRADPPVVIITGAAGDIGRSTAELLSERGWALGLVDHPAAGAGLHATAEACEALGAPTWGGTFDVLAPDDIAAAVATCSSALGPPSGLFNNAGVQGPFQRIDRYRLDDAQHVVEVNVVGALNVLSIVATAMVAAGAAGSIVCSASMAGVTGAPNMAAYSASKAAVIAMAKSAAKDLAPVGIRVNAISPAFIGPGQMWDAQVAAQAAVDSPYFADRPDEVARQMISMIPLRRYGSTLEVANVVAFLLSDDASYLTGLNIEIAGGSS
jgi:NAD(P)-dependent dehydrogenase (short-subunit alcohol dehydrogenase family)